MSTVQTECIFYLCRNEPTTAVSYERPCGHVDEYPPGHGQTCTPCAMRLERQPHDRHASECWECGDLNHGRVHRMTRPLPVTLAVAS